MNFDFDKPRALVVNTNNWSEEDIENFKEVWNKRYYSDRIPIISVAEPIDKNYDVMFNRYDR